MNRHISIDIDDGGRLRFSNDASEQLFTLDRYRYTTAAIHQLYFPIESNEVRLRSTNGLVAGDTVELRNEFKDGRVNRPIVHRCTITDVRDTAIEVDRAPEDVAILAERGAFLWKTRSGSIDDFAIRRSRHTAEAQYWQVAGEAEDLRVRLSIWYDVPRMNLAFFVERTYLQETHIVNESLALIDLPPLATVFRKNRQVGKRAFARETWLERQGASFTDGTDRHVLIQHAPRVSSLRLTKDVAAGELVPVTKFFAAPHDLTAAGSWSARHSYASATSRPGEKVIFEIAFPAPVDVRGLRVAWLRVAGKPPSVAVIALDGEQAIASEVFQCDPKSISDELILHPETPCEKLRVEVTPGTVIGSAGRVFIDHVEPLFGDRDFALVVNLDDYRDHRFYSHLEPEHREYTVMSRWTENRSAYRRTRGDLASSDFSVYLGTPPDFDLRVMHVPHAYDAMLIWTEHADASTLNSHRAVYFGRSDITQAKETVGGFVGWDIPVTKSVFFDNPDKLPPRRGMDTEQAAVCTSPEFWDFCKQLEAAGHDVCLHSDQPQVSSPDSVAAAIDVFYANFSSRSWIDHSPVAIHGSASGQGTRRGSRYYAVPRWLHHGVRYFWCVGNEDFGSGDQRSGLNVLETRGGDHRVTPLYWEHELEAPGLVFWPALRGGYADVYTDDSIEQLIRERGVCVNHTYPAALYLSQRSTKRYMEIATDGSARTTNVFETALRTISAARDAGKLLPTTVTKALGYLRQLHDVKVEFRPDNSAIISNYGGEDIAGFSFAADGQLEVESELAGVTSRKSSGDVLVSLTLEARAAVAVSRDGGALKISQPAVGRDLAEAGDHG